MYRRLVERHRKRLQLVGLDGGGEGDWEEVGWRDEGNGIGPREGSGNSNLRFFK